MKIIGKDLQRYVMCTQTINCINVVGRLEMMMYAKIVVIWDIRKLSIF